MEDFFVRKKEELGVVLHDVQRQAVVTTEGPVLLLATPGSGKTTTLIMRIGYLIEEKGVLPERIKAVTFSRAAADDMKRRFRSFFPSLPMVDFSTIHSFAFTVVRDYLRHQNVRYEVIEGTNASIPHDLHKKQLIKKLALTITEESVTEDQLEELMTYISYVKNKCLPEAEWDTIPIDVKKAAEIFRAYEQYKKTGYHCLLLDYDDMLTMAESLLAEHETLRQYYAGRYDYVLTDESQDTSLIQHKIVEKLVQQHQNLCVVADDDQAIYSWRGAEPSYLLRFRDVYPNAVTLFMEQNYRSTKNIVNAANAFIKRNKNRYEKEMFTTNRSQQDIVFTVLPDHALQAKHLVKQIRDIKNLQEVAVLYRNKYSSIMLMQEFARAGIPFYMKDADHHFFSHWVVADILNFMRMTFTDKRVDLFENIYQKMNGYISKKQMEAVKRVHSGESVFDTLLYKVKVEEYQIKTLHDNKETLQEMKDMPPLQAIEVIRTRLGYDQAIERRCQMLGLRKDYLISILETLEDIADGLETMVQFANRLKELAALLKESKTKTEENVVTFSTLHSAKGLEFSRVYMMDLIEEVIPADTDAEKLAEEARLFYVGMTRAKHYLEFLTYKRKDRKDVRVSRFVEEVDRIMHPPIITEQKKVWATKPKQDKTGTPKVAPPVATNNPDGIHDASTLIVGKNIHHRVFGSGTILNIAEEVIEIQFTEQIKSLSLEMCLRYGLLEAGEG